MSSTGATNGAGSGSGTTGSTTGLGLDRRNGLGLDRRNRLGRDGRQLDHGLNSRGLDGLRLGRGHQRDRLELDRRGGLGLGRSNRRRRGQLLGSGLRRRGIGGEVVDHGSNRLDGRPGAIDGSSGST